MGGIGIGIGSVIRQVPLRFGVDSGQSARSRPRETRPEVRVLGLVPSLFGQLLDPVVDRLSWIR